MKAKNRRSLPSLILPLLLSFGCAAAGGAVQEDASRGLKEAGVYVRDAAHLTFQVWALEGEQKRIVREGDELRTGDQIEIEIKSDADIYVYLLQFFADGSSAVLAKEVRARKGEFVRLPERGGYYELDEFTGVEHLYFLASQSRLSDVDQAAAGLIAKVEASPGKMDWQKEGNDKTPALGQVMSVSASQPGLAPEPKGSSESKSDKGKAPPKGKGGGGSKKAMKAESKEPEPEQIAMASLLTSRGFKAVPAEGDVSAYVQTDSAGVAVIHYWVGHRE